MRGRSFLWVFCRNAVNINFYVLQTTTEPPTFIEWFETGLYLKVIFESKPRHHKDLRPQHVGGLFYWSQWFSSIRICIPWSHQVARGTLVEDPFTIGLGNPRYPGGNDSLVRSKPVLKSIYRTGKTLRNNSSDFCFCLVKARRRLSKSAKLRRSLSWAVAWFDKKRSASAIWASTSRGLWSRTHKVPSAKPSGLISGALHKIWSVAHPLQCPDRRNESL